MSVIVAIKENDRIYLGCDSQVTKGGTRKTFRNPNNYKIWKVKGVKNTVMGSVGLIRDANIVRLMNNLITDYDEYKGNIDYEYVVKSILPDIFHELKDRGYYKDDATYDDLQSTFFFAYHDKLFIIDNDGCVFEIDDCAAIGSGATEAIGSLLSTEGQSPKERIIKAIKASAANDIYVDYPIIITDTKDTEFDIVTQTNEKDYFSK